MIIRHWPYLCFYRKYYNDAQYMFNITFMTVRHESGEWLIYYTNIIRIVLYVFTIK